MKSKLLLVPLLLLAFISCKKEEYLQPQQFGIVRFDNLSGLSELKLSHNNNLYTNGGLNNVKIPSGKGTFSFIDPATNTSLLDTVITIEANTVQDMILFKPSEEAPLILLKNTQQDEPKPDPGYAKVKIANLAAKAFPNSIDLIEYLFDDNLYDYVPVDTLKNISRKFEDGYVIIKNATSVNDPSILFKIIDSKTKQSLTDFLIYFNNIDPNTGMPYSVFTIYIKDDYQGFPVAGSDYKINIDALFKN